MKKTKYLKVYYLFQGFKELPYIRLTGKWLQKLGFNRGDYIKLTLKKNRIIIDKIPNPKQK